MSCGGGGDQNKKQTEQGFTAGSRKAEEDHNSQQDKDGTQGYTLGTGLQAVVDIGKTNKTQTAEKIETHTNAH